MEAYAAGLAMGGQDLAMESYNDSFYDEEDEDME